MNDALDGHRNIFFHTGLDGFYHLLEAPLLSDHVMGGGCRTVQAEADPVQVFSYLRVQKGKNFFLKKEPVTDQTESNPIIRQDFEDAV